MRMVTRTPPPRLQRATPVDDPAEVLVQTEERAKGPAEDGPAKPESPKARRPEPASVRASKNARTGDSDGEGAPVDLTAPVVRKRARYVEQFNTRLTPEMREAVDKHVAATGETVVDLVDRALRLALGIKK